MKRPVVLQLQDGIKLLSSELMENAEGSGAAVESSTEAAAAKVSDALLKAGLAAMMNEPETRTQAAQVMLSIVEAQTEAQQRLRLMQAQKSEEGDFAQDTDRNRTAPFGEAAAENAWALHGACWRMKTAEVEHFVNMVDDLDVAADEFGYTPLHVAAITGSADVLEILLNARALRGIHGVDPLDERRQTPLMRAAARGNEGVVRMLLLARADVNAEDQDGMKPLSIATFGKRTNIQEILLSYGANKDSLATGRDLCNFLQGELNLDVCGIQYAETMAGIRKLHGAPDIAEQHGFRNPGSSHSNVDSNEP